MKEKTIDQNTVCRFQKHLLDEEKSEATIEKYVRDVKVFADYAHGVPITKETVIAYKQRLVEEGYAIRSINSMLASINSLFCYLGWTEMKVKSLKLQQAVFCPEERELTKAEYERLCRTAKKRRRERLLLVLQTICSTGIRVSELPYITVESVREGQADVSLKGKTRTVLLPNALRKKLKRYVAVRRLQGGPVFVTRSGRPLSRTNIWREMKGLCAEAAVDARKVFPHNLRHLFARVFYALEKDIVRLADILGHSSVDTTRIYIVSSGAEHRHHIERMRLVI